MGVERIARTMAWAELRGRNRGLRGASSTWLAVWVVATAYRQLRKITAREPVVVRRDLEPGQQLVITHYEKGSEPPPPPKGRRARKRAQSQQQS